MIASPFSRRWPAVMTGVIGMLLASPMALAQFAITVNAEAGAVNNEYTLFPRFSMLQNGSPTTAVVTFSSPNHLFEGYVNQGVASSSVGTLPTAAVLSEANGTWTIRVQTAGQNPQVFNYTAQVALTPPFTNLPRFQSAELVSGNVYDGTIGFSLVDGSAAYPGPAASIRARLFDAAENLLETAILPITATSWSPQFDVSGLGSVQVIIDTENEAVDALGLNVSNVVPLNPAASPGLSISASTIQYFAYREATLVVPEPASLSGMVAGLLLLRRCRPSA